MAWAIQEPMTFAATPTAVTVSSEYSPWATLKPAKSIVPSEGMGRQALSPTISRKTPTNPILSMTSTANWTSGSVIEATSTAPRVETLGRFDTRERQRRHPLLGPADVRLGPQHLEDHHRLVDVGGHRGAVRDVVGSESLGDVALDAGDDQLALAGPQRARSVDQALEHEVGDPDGFAEVEDEPADPAFERRFDAAAQLAGALQGAENVDLMHDVVKPVLLEPNGARLWYGSQGLRREHCAARESRVQRISRAAKTSSLQRLHHPTS